MIITSTFKFVFQNVHKSRTHTHALLDSLQSGIDILFVQEASFKIVRKTVSTTCESSDDVVGPVIHHAWRCIDKHQSFPTTQVSIYINKRITHTHETFMDPFRIPDPNTLVVDITQLADSSTTSFICIYNPRELTTPPLKHYASP
jgi:hypothetical protein